jgi:hypothetical protein
MVKIMVMGIATGPMCHKENLQSVNQEVPNWVVQYSFSCCYLPPPPQTNQRHVQHCLEV